MTAPLEISARRYTVDEYLQLEEAASAKHYFINGKIIPMPGATYTHNLIAANFITALNNAIAEKELPYFVLNSDMKVFVPRTTSFLYPEAIVICEEPEHYNGRKDTLLNPLLIIEVLSPSTADYDRGSKFFDYKRISSFREYVLVEQNMPFVTSSYKQEESIWKDGDAEGRDALIYLRSIDCAIPLQKIYRGVKF